MNRVTRLLTIAYLLIAFGAGAPEARAQDSVDRNAQAFMELYMKTCLRFFGKPDALRAEMEKSQLSRIPREKAAFFLSGEKGDAWSSSSFTGEYVVSLRADGVCAVFAQRAKDSDVQKLFSELVEGLAIPPMTVKREEDESSVTPNGPTRYVTYKYAKPGAKGALHFALTTASSDEANIQAMATLSMVRD